MLPHHGFAQVGIAKPQGHQNPAMALDGSMAVVQFLQRVLAVPKHVLSHGHHLIVEAGLVANEFVERIVEPGVPAGDVVQAPAPQRIVGLPDGLFELLKLPFAQPSTDDAEGIPLQEGSQLNDLLHFLLRVVGGSETSCRQRCDDPFRFELVECLSDRGPADSELFGQLHFRQPVPRSKPTRQDEGSQARVRVFSHRNHVLIGGSRRFYAHLLQTPRLVRASRTANGQWL
jgi:hypothetical protein